VKDKAGVDLSEQAAYLAYIIGKVFRSMLEKSYVSFEEVTQQREKSSTYQDTVEEDEEGDHDGISVEMRAHPAMVAAFTVFQDVFIRPILQHEEVGIFMPKLMSPIRYFLVDYWGPADERLQRQDRQLLHIYHFNDGFFSCIASKSLRETSASFSQHGHRADDTASSSNKMASAKSRPSRLSPEWESVARSYVRICSNISQELFDSSFLLSAGMARIVCATYPQSDAHIPGSSIHDNSASGSSRGPECMLLACIHVSTECRELLHALPYTMLLKRLYTSRWYSSDFLSYYFAYCLSHRGRAICLSR
jgi:hypothetical protein